MFARPSVASVEGLRIEIVHAYRSIRARLVLRCLDIAHVLLLLLVLLRKVLLLFSLANGAGHDGFNGTSGFIIY